MCSKDQAAGKACVATQQPVTNQSLFETQLNNVQVLLELRPMGRQHQTSCLGFSTRHENKIVHQGVVFFITTNQS